MSDTEKLYYQLQEKTGGTLGWNQLTGREQQTFVDAVNFLLWTTSRIRPTVTPDL